MWKPAALFRRLVTASPMPSAVRALGPDGGDGGVVEGPQGVEDPPGLLPLVPGGAQAP